MTKPSFSIEVVNFVTYHGKGLYHSKTELELVYIILVCVFHYILVNTSYFHKVSIHTQTN